MLKLIRTTPIVIVWNINFDNCKVLGKYTSHFLRPVILIAILLSTTPAAGDMSFGVKLGPVSVDTPSRSDPINIAGDLGYEIDTLLANLSLAVEVNRTIINGETKKGEDLKFKSNGIYLVYKTNKSLYMTFRGGVVQNEIVSGSNSRRNNGISLGGGIGGVVGRGRVQIEYTLIAADANYLSICLEF